MSIKGTDVYSSDPSYEEFLFERKLHEEVVPELSKSVLSLYTFDGNQIHDHYTGIVMESNACSTRILTSASGIRSFQDPKRTNQNLLIYVNLPNGEITFGCFEKIDLDCNILIVRIGPFPDFREVCLENDCEFRYNIKVEALCCSEAREVMVSTGVVTEKSSELYGQRLVLSTCKIPKFGIGGPLVDVGGYFVGMNTSCLDDEGTTFLPKEQICLSFVPFRIRFGITQASIEICKFSTTLIPEESTSEKSPDTVQKASVSSSSSDSETECQDIKELMETPDFCPLPDNEFTKEFTKDLLSRGYPLPLTLEGGMYLRNNFEEEFPEDTWNELTEKVALNTSLSVVSLASFRGDSAVEKTRFFACTGVIIGHVESMTRILTSASLVRLANGKIDENLKIQVLLPNNECVEGELQHYDSCYNIAVVNIRGFQCRRIAKLHTKGLSSTKVVAIGHTFETGKLMATSGALTDNSNKLVSDEHGISTCKITKAGIGGPLIDLYGNFIGMNFYGAKKTPYLPSHKILELLKEFDRKRCFASAVRADNVDPYRWSVPMPNWYYPSLAPCRIWGRRRYD